jgi:hypothetical protein
MKDRRRRQRAGRINKRRVKSSAKVISDEDWVLRPRKRRAAAIRAAAVGLREISDDSDQSNDSRWDAEEEEVEVGAVSTGDAQHFSLSHHSLNYFVMFLFVAICVHFALSFRSLALFVYLLCGDSLHMPSPPVSLTFQMHHITAAHISLSRIFL